MNGTSFASRAALGLAITLACRFDASGTGTGSASDGGTGGSTDAVDVTGTSPTDTSATTTSMTATTAMTGGSGETADPTTESGSTGPSESSGSETGVPGVWWNLEWGKRRRIALALPPDVDETLVNVPVPIVLDTLDIPYGELQLRGQDLRFVDADDTTPLPYEIERWDPEGQSLVWVTVPELEPDDAIFMYWGNDAAPAGQDSAEVWAFGFGGVYHLADDPEGKAGTYRDSSPGDRHAVPEGSMTSDDLVPGVSSPALAFDGIDDAAAIAGLDTNDWTEITVSAWINRTSDGDERIVGKAFDPASNGHVFLLRILGGSVYARLRTDGEDQTTTELFGAYVPTRTWTHVAMVWSHAEAELRIFVDGIQVAALPQTGQTLFNDNSDVLVANALAGQDGFFEGAIDEVRIEHDARSGDWLLTQVAAIRDEIATFEVEETVP